METSSLCRITSYRAFNFEIPNEENCTADAGTLKFDKCRGYANSETLNFSIRRVQKIKLRKLAEQTKFEYGIPLEKSTRRLKFETIDYSWCWPVARACGKEGRLS